MIHLQLTFQTTGKARVDVNLHNLYCYRIFVKVPRFIPSISGTKGRLLTDTRKFKS
jgi:hypothetical protein